MSDVIKTQFDTGTIVIKDGTGTPLECTVEFDRGDFSLDGIANNGREVEKYESRGVLHSARYTARKYPTGSFSAMVSQFSNDSTGTALDMILGTGEFAARVGTRASTGDVITLDITFTVEGTDFGDSADHTFTLHDCVIEASFAEGSPDALSFTFEVLGEIDGDIAITVPT